MQYQQNVPQHYYLLDTLVNINIMLVKSQILKIPVQTLAITAIMSVVDQKFYLNHKSKLSHNTQ